MRVDKVIRKRFRTSGAGVNLASDISAVIAARVGDAAGTHEASTSEQHVSIVQTGGQTTVRHHSATSAARPNKEA